MAATQRRDRGTSHLDTSLISCTPEEVRLKPRSVHPAGLSIVGLIAIIMSLASPGLSVAAVSQ